MSSTRFNQSTTPEQFIAVHDRGPHDADVRERKRVNGRVLGLVLGTVGKRVPAKGVHRDRYGHRDPAPRHRLRRRPHSVDDRDVLTESLEPPHTAA